MISAETLTESASYDFNTGTVTSQTDPFNQTVSYAYSPYEMRPTTTTSPTGVTVSKTYNDTTMTGTTTTSYTENFVTKTLTESETYNGWMQVKQAFSLHKSGQVNTSHDATGRVSSITNPFAAGGQPGSSTMFQYDALGGGRKR